MRIGTDTLFIAAHRQRHVISFSSLSAGLMRFRRHPCAFYFRLTYFAEADAEQQVASLAVVSHENQLESRSSCSFGRLHSLLDRQGRCSHQLQIAITELALSRQTSNSHDSQSWRLRAPVQATCIFSCRVAETGLVVSGHSMHARETPRSHPQRAPCNSALERISFRVR